MANKLFYLNGQPIDVEISPVLAQTLDETIDNLTITLKLDESYGDAPLDPLKNEVALVHVDDNNVATTINKFVISADNVQLATENPLRFKHTLTLVQRAQVLTKKESRNTVFSTSLESSVFSLTVGKTKNLHHFDGYGFSLAPGIKETSTYVNIGSQRKSLINLASKKIKKIVFKKYAWAEIYDNFSVVTTPPSEFGIDISWTLYCKQIKPNNLSDIAPRQNQTYKPIATLYFQIDDEPVRTQVLSDDLYNSDIEIDIDDSILTWIKSHNSGMLEIYLDFTISTEGYEDVLLKDNLIPIIANVNCEFFINSVEKSCYYVIETLLKQQLKETADYNEGNDEHIKPLFKLPTPDHNQNLYNLLNETSAPNFVFTQGNVYEMLVEIFKLFDAIFTIDNDGYLDIEYYNEQSQHKIEFEEGKKAGRQSSLGEERYGNRLISYYQNTKINDKFPNSNQEKATAYLRSKTIGVPQPNDFVFIVPKPIDIILSVKCKCQIVANYQRLYNDDYLIHSSGTGAGSMRSYLTFGFTLSEDIIDITKYVNETTIWSILPEDKTMPVGGSWDNVGKFNSLNYSIGSKFIECGVFYDDTLGYKTSVLQNVLLSATYSQLGLNQANDNFNINPPDWSNIKLAVSYIALADGKVVNESIDYKYDGGMIINQNNGSIDINKLGLNMVGLSLKLGQPTLTMTQKICTWEKAVKKGDYFIKDGARWVANTCNYTLINKDLIEASIEFVKNFNGLASRIELNREKRLSNISNELTVKCEETYGEFIYYSNKYPQQFYGEKTVFEDNFLANSLLMGFNLTLVEGSIAERYDATNRIVNGSISGFDPSQYTNKQLVRITGYLQSKTYEDNPTGMLILNTNRDGSGNQIVIPYASTDLISLRHNFIEDSFEMNRNYYDSHDMTTVDPFNLMTEEEQIEVLVLCDNGQIVCGAVTDDLDVATSGWFDPTVMFQFVPQNDYTIEYASLTALDENGNVIQEDEYNASDVAIPMVIYGSGNSICFEMSFDSPIAAGTQLLNNYTSVYASGGWFSKYVLYAAKDGTATKFTIDFIMLQEELTRQFPKLAHDNGQGIATTPLATYSFGKIREFAYYKKPNEIFALNYQLHFLPFGDLNDCFLSNEYIKNNGFSNGLNKKTFQVIYTTVDDPEEDVVFEYSIMDTKGYGRNTADIVAHAINNESSNHRMSIEFETELTTQEIRKIKTWAIVDEQNNLYFSCNHTPEQERFEIWFIYMHHRKEEV